jgi:hypothetical protein
MITASRFLLTFTAAIAAAFLVPHRANAVSDDDLATYLRVKAELEQEDAVARQKVEDRIPIVREKVVKKKAEIADRYAAHGRLELVPAVSKPRIRRSFADLLATEAGNLGGFEPGQTKALKDLKPATFAYTNDFEHDFDTWTAQAALIWPLVFKTGITPRGQFCVPIFGLMPSFTVNRFTTNRQPTDADDLKKIEEEEQNEVVYRLGSFAQLYITPDLSAIVRANALWKTDTGHESSEPGFEIEFEPLWQSPDNPAIGLGYLAVPQWAKRPGFNPNDPETYKHAWLGYQARLRARFLGGSVQDDGNGKEGPEYSRAGLTAELNLTPFIFERLSASVSYTFMPVICGNIAQDFYLESGLGYTIYESPAEKRQVTAELKYLWGAADNKGQKVQDQVTASIGVIF